MNRLADFEMAGDLKYLNFPNRKLDAHIIIGLFYRYASRIQGSV